MKILIITDAYPYRRKPYAYPNNHARAKVLSKIGKVKVTTLIREKKFSFGFIKYFWDNIEVEAIQMPYIPKLGLLFFPLSVLLHFFLIFKNLLLFKPDIVYVQMSLPHGIAYLPFSKFKKFILQENTTRAANYLITITGLVIKAALLRYAPSSYYKKVLEKTYKLKFDGIIPTPIIHNIHSKKTVKIKNQVVFVGRLDENKSPHLFIELAKLNPHLKFILIGPDPNTHYSKNILKNLPSNVQYKGPLPYEKVLLEMKESDFLISTSKIDTFATVTAEALSVGTPVIWTDSGGARDFLDEKNSILVRERTPEALNKALQEGYHKLKNNYFKPLEISQRILQYAGINAVENRYKNMIKLYYQKLKKC